MERLQEHLKSSCLRYSTKVLFTVPPNSEIKYLPFLQQWKQVMSKSSLCPTWPHRHPHNRHKHTQTQHERIRHTYDQQILIIKREQWRKDLTQTHTHTHTHTHTPIKLSECCLAGTAGGRFMIFNMQSNWKVENQTLAHTHTHTTYTPTSQWDISFRAPHSRMNYMKMFFSSYGDRQQPLTHNRSLPAENTEPSHH